MDEGQLAEFDQLKRALLREVAEVVVGQEQALEGLLIGLFAQGHVLLEGVPGTAKTLMVRALAAAVGLEFGRIQFTPDLMPSDIVGTHVFDLQAGQRAGMQTILFWPGEPLPPFLHEADHLLRDFREAVGVFERLGGR